MIVERDTSELDEEFCVVQNNDGYKGFCESVDINNSKHFYNVGDRVMLTGIITHKSVFGMGPGTFRIAVESVNQDNFLPEYALIVTPAIAQKIHEEKL